MSLNYINIPISNTFWKYALGDSIMLLYFLKITQLSYELELE